MQPLSENQYELYTDISVIPSSKEDAAQDQHEKKASWYGMSWLLLSDVVGSSVLSFSGVTASLGWLMSIISMILFCYLAYYSALLMSTARTLIHDATGVSPGSMGEMARQLMGDRAAKIMYILVYGIFAFLGNASYLLVLGTSLDDIFDYWNVDLCNMSASLYACLFVLPMAATVRQLRSVSTICFVNLFIILALLAICLSQITKDGRGANVTTDLVNPHLTLLSFSQAMANTLYAYAGHWMYFEIMAEMQTPTDFPKSAALFGCATLAANLGRTVWSWFQVFWINAPLQLSIYMTVAVTGYYYLGSQGEHYLIDNLTPGSKTRLIVQMMLFVHISIAFLIKNVALTRFVVSRVSSEAALDSKAPKDRLLYAACSAGILALGWVVANAMPVFYDLVGLIGALLCGPISFVFPVGFFVLARMLTTASPILNPSTEEKRRKTDLKVSEYCEDEGNRQGRAPSIRAVLTWVQSNMPVHQIAFMSTVILFISLIMVTGSISAIKDIHKKVADGEASVFSC